MDMPVIVEVVDKQFTLKNLKEIFDFFQYVDNKFSVFKKTSEITRINEGKLKKTEMSPDMKTIFKLAGQTKKETGGYFNIRHGDFIDPSGIVKGWAIFRAAQLLNGAGFKNYYVEAGGDIQVAGRNKDHEPWKIGIRNPFNTRQIVKSLTLGNGEGVATSGTYERGFHIYNPKNLLPVKEIVSLTVVGPNIHEADRFATAAFAMGKDGILFIEKMPGLEGYMIDTTGMATFTSGLMKYAGQTNNNMHKFMNS